MLTLTANLEDHLNCCICLELFTEPRTLKCQHTCCTKCLAMLLAENSMLSCPKCRTKSFHANVTEIPRNHLMDELIEQLKRGNAAAEASAEISVPEVLHPQCPLCKQHKELTTCQHCLHDFCNLCQKVHIETQLDRMNQQLSNVPSYLKHVEACEKNIQAAADKSMNELFVNMDRLKATFLTAWQEKDTELSQQVDNYYHAKKMVNQGETHADYQLVHKLKMLLSEKEFLQSLLRQSPDNSSYQSRLAKLEQSVSELASSAEADFIVPLQKTYFGTYLRIAENMPDRIELVESMVQSLSLEEVTMTTPPKTKNTALVFPPLPFWAEKRLEAPHVYNNGMEAADSHHVRSHAHTTLAPIPPKSAPRTLQVLAICDDLKNMGCSGKGFWYLPMTIVTPNVLKDKIVIPHSKQAIGVESSRLVLVNTYTGLCLPDNEELLFRSNKFFKRPADMISQRYCRGHQSFTEEVQLKFFYSQSWPF